MKKPIPLLVVTSLAVGLLAGIAFWNGAGPALPPPELEVPLLPEPRPITPFQLTDHDGNRLDADSLRGRWSVVFIGYTHCPDVCPTTLQTMTATARHMAESPDGMDHTRFIFVSVDPKRDSPAQLKEYLAYFHPAFIGATGEREQIDALVRQLGAIYMFEGDTTGDSYIVNHSATLYVVDPQGRFYARLQPPHDAAQIADTLARIRHFYER
ncbi:MAG: SCO family protein [Thiohalomonadaceae bacterium]